MAAGVHKVLCGHVRGEGLRALLPARGVQGAQTRLQTPLVGEVLGRSDVGIAVPQYVALPADRLHMQA